MTIQDIKDRARGFLGSYCKACPECNGRACRNQIPGPGAKGVGDVAILNYDAWKQIRINMDTIAPSVEPDTRCKLFGHEFSAPVFAGPVGAVNLHYGSSYTDSTYNDVLVSACAANGVAAFTGDGTNPVVMESACQAIGRMDGMGIPTVKPWDMDTVLEKLSLVRQCGAIACAMDIDAAGLPFLKDRQPPAGSKTTEELNTIIRHAGVPFIVKGIMTVKGALKAKEAGAAAIVVSNHGGRVMDQCPSTAQVLPEIAQAVGEDMTILVDGGIRDGVDIFKALALGADAVLLARPFVTAVYGGGEEGVTTMIKTLREELADTMRMCGVSRLSEIGPECVTENKWR